MKKKKLKKSAIFFFLFLVLIGGGILFYFNKDYLLKEKVILKKEIQPVKENISYGVFHDTYQEAKDKVKEMSLEEKIGQLFLVRYSRYAVDENNGYYPGGYILFARDFQGHSKESMKKEIDYVQEISKYPLIIGVDEEGGTVVRVSQYFRYDSFESPKYYYDQGGFELLEERENEKAELLKSIGINLNLAPVADLPTSEWDFIYRRSFGTDVDLTSEYIHNMVTYSKNNGINSCLKHFPGYGNNVDTHTGVAIDERNYQNFLDRDYKPFESGIVAGVPCVLISHNIVSSIDSSYPSSLSQKVVLELRDRLGFTGIAITDDLAMDAVSQYVSDGNAATMAVNAGNDMIITSDFISMYYELLKSVQNGVVKEERINDAATKVLALKYYSGLF